MRALLALPLLALALAGCFGTEETPDACYAREEKTLGDIPFGNEVNSFERNGRVVWDFWLVAPNACLEQPHAPITAMARVAPASPDCPAGDATAGLEAAAGPTQGTRVPLQAAYDGGDAVFRGSTEVGLGQFSRPVGIVASVEVELPKAEDAAKDRACAMDRIKRVELVVSYMQAKAEAAPAAPEG